jgi:predicted nuclease of predicted toxin-antitoxin system
VIERLSIRFFTDNNVPDSVGNFLRAAGHDVTRLREVMLTDTSDPIIEFACSRSGHVLVTHDNDFRIASKRLRLTQRQYQNQLHRVQLRCDEPLSARRVEAAMSLIEHEWAILQADRPMVIEIKNELIRVLR